MVHIFQYIGERSNCILVGFLFQISKIFKNLVNNRLLAHLNKCGPFSDTQYGSRSSFANANLLTVVSGRIVTSFKKFGTTEVVAVDILRPNQSNLLVFRHDRPYFSKNKRNNITKFWLINIF